MNNDLDRWQGPDGFPTGAYFAAVENELRRRGVPVSDSWRDEPWDYVLQLWDAEHAPDDGPLSWARYGLHLVWRVDEWTQARHADDFGALPGDLGWYWTAHTTGHALADRVMPLGLAWIAEPDEVADTVLELLVSGPPHRGGPS